MSLELKRVINKKTVEIINDFSISQSVHNNISFW